MCMCVGGRVVNAFICLCMGVCICDVCAYLYTTLVVPSILCHTHMVDCVQLAIPSYRCQWVKHLVMLTITQTHPNKSCSGAFTRLPSGNLADSVVCQQSRPILSPQLFIGAPTHS